MQLSTNIKTMEEEVKIVEEVSAENIAVSEGDEVSFSVETKEEESSEEVSE